MIHDLIRTDLIGSSDWTDRLMFVILNAEIIRQLYRRFSWGQTEKAAGEINYITIRLASEAMEAFINLHARIPVIVERTFAHASASHLQAVALGGLKRGHTGFDCFKNRHLHHRSCAGFFFSACFLFRLFLFSLRCGTIQIQLRVQLSQTGTLGFQLFLLREGLAQL